MLCKMMVRTIAMRARKLIRGFTATEEIAKLAPMLLFRANAVRREKHEVKYESCNQVGRGNSYDPTEHFEEAIWIEVLELVL